MLHRLYHYAVWGAAGRIYIYVLYCLLCQLLSADSTTTTNHHSRTFQCLPQSLDLLLNPFNQTRLRSECPSWRRCWRGARSNLHDLSVSWSSVLIKQSTEPLARPEKLRLLSEFYFLSIPQKSTPWKLLVHWVSVWEQSVDSVSG